MCYRERFSQPRPLERTVNCTATRLSCIRSFSIGLTYTVGSRVDMMCTVMHRELREQQSSVSDGSTCIVTRDEKGFTEGKKPVDNDI